jgi:hypothetical protein
MEISLWRYTMSRQYMLRSVPALPIVAPPRTALVCKICGACIECYEEWAHFCAHVNDDSSPVADQFADGFFQQITISSGKKSRDVPFGASRDALFNASRDVPFGASSSSSSFSPNKQSPPGNYRPSGRSPNYFSPTISFIHISPDS